MTLREDWAKWRYDRMLVRWRSPLAGVFTIGIAILLALLIRTIVWGEYYGITTLEVIEGLLAGGTLALAYAALVQAESAERRREADFCPHLELRVMERNPDALGGPKGALATDTFYIAGGQDTMAIEVRSLGPGHASDVRIFTLEWWSPLFVQGGEPSELISNPGPEPGPITTATRQGTEFVNVPFSLTAGESYDHEFRFATHTYDKTAAHMYLRQFVVAASAKTVEGEGLTEARMGLLLTRLFPTEQRMGETVVGRGYQTAWRRLTDSEVRGLPRSKLQ